jgi:hypothetical protein
VIEAFTGKKTGAETILNNINHLRNAFNLENNAHERFYELTWGIEAVLTGR